MASGGAVEARIGDQREGTVDYPQWPLTGVVQGEPQRCDGLLDRRIAWPRRILHRRADARQAIAAGTFDACHRLTTARGNDGAGGKGVVLFPG